MFNTPCGTGPAAGGAGLTLWGSVVGNTPAQEVGMWLEANRTHLKITAAGPADRW